MSLFKKKTVVSKSNSYPAEVRYYVEKMEKYNRIAGNTRLRWSVW